MKDGKTAFNDNRLYGEQMHDLMERLYPLCRSITGDGVRETLHILKEYVPSLEISEVPTGTEVYDWVIPMEWKVNGAWLKYRDSDEKIIDFKNSNLHLLNYSRPFHGIVDYETLVKHCFTLEEYPDYIPYRTAYYTDTWGFCMSYNQFVQLDKSREYEINIDTTLFDGALTYGEIFIQGQTEEEVLISTYLCHPSLCNDNLSGVVLSVFLANFLLKEKELRHSYRFIFVPETIGAITWLARNEDKWGGADKTWFSSHLCR